MCDEEEAKPRFGSDCADLELPFFLVEGGFSDLPKPGIVRGTDTKLPLGLTVDEPLPVGVTPDVQRTNLPNRADRS